MRRSSRERKSVQFFTVQDFRGSAVVSSSEDEEQESSEEENIPQKKETSSKKEKPGKKKKNLMQAEKVITTKRRGAAAAVTKSRSKNALFHAVVSGKDVPGAVEKWIASFKGNSVGAMSDIINFVLLMSGGQVDHIPSNMDLEGLDTTELEEVLSDMISRVKGEQAKHKKKKATRSISDSIGYAYPLGTDRGNNTIRNHYQCFWHEFITRIIALQEQQSSQKLNLNTLPMKMLLPLVDILMALSNISPLPSVRDAVSEALLQMSVSILSVCVVPLRAQVESSNRQMTSASGGRRGEGSTKVSAIRSQKNKAEQSIDHYSNLISTIFNTIFVHRYKDFFSVIRCNCVYYLGELMQSDPQNYVEGVYLKYLGWLSNDASALVRRAVVNALNSILSGRKIEESISIPQRLREFSERFMERWVEMAVGDVDEEVSFGAMKMMREFQRLGLIDELEQEKLDEVDKEVFDAETSPRIRAEALLFLMDHTEGFEDEEEDDASSRQEDSGSRKRRKSDVNSRRKSGEEQRLLAKNKRIVAQIETLAEFVEYHLSDDDTGAQSTLEEALGNMTDSTEWGQLEEANAVSDRESNLLLLLVEACLSIPQKADILSSWNIFMSLLLRDSDGLTAVVLDERYVSTILRMFVCSAGIYYQRRLRDAENSRQRLTGDVDDDESGQEEVATKRKRGVQSSRQIDKKSDGYWTRLVESVIHSFPELLKRFKGSDTHVSLILRLLYYCADDVVPLPSHSGSRFNDKTLRALFNAVLGEIKTSHASDKVAQLASILRVWLSRIPKEGEHSNNPSNVLLQGVSDILSASFDKVGSSLKIIDGASLSIVAPTNRNKRGNTSLPDVADDISNGLFDLASSMSKFSGLWLKIDCRNYFDESISSVCELMENVSVTLLQVVSNESLDIFQNHDANERLNVHLMQCLRCLLSCARCLQTVCLWITLDIFSHAQTMHMNQEDDSEQDLGKNSSVHADLFAVRDTLVDVLNAWLSLSWKEAKTLISPLFVRKLQCEAFRIIGDLRIQFPQKLLDDYSETISALAWNPPTTLVTRMEEVFGNEEKELENAMENLDTELSGEIDLDEEEASIKRRDIANQVVWTLLNPLGGMKYDVDHLNRKQAAAILKYLVYDGSEHVQNIVNDWLKRLKEKDTAKYLESMLLALKKLFEDSVLSSLHELKQATEELDSYQVDKMNSRGSRVRREEAEGELERNVERWTVKVDRGWKRMNQLSRRCAQTLGVGKCSGEIAEYVLQLLQVAMKFSLQSRFHLAFFAAIESFLGKLKAADIRVVNARLTSLLDELKTGTADDGLFTDIVRAVTAEKSDEMEVTEEESRCLEAFVAYAEKAGWSPEGLSAESSPKKTIKGHRRPVRAKEPLQQSPESSNESGDDEEGTVTMVDSSQPFASGLHLEELSADDASVNASQNKKGQVMSQSSEKSDDIFEEFDLRASRRRFGQ